jgi:hypothetical protein
LGYPLNDQEKKIEPRKASDVLLALEEKIEKLSKTVELSNTNLLYILNTVNHLFALSKLTSSASPAIPTIQQSEALQNPNAIMIDGGVPIEVATDIVGVRRTDRLASNNPTSNVEFKDYTAKSDRKIPVIQRIQDTNKKDFILAEVSIFTLNNQLITKVKTNATGKWQSHLSPGKYIVKVIKINTSSHTKSEATTEIIVPDSDSPVILPLLVMQR